MILTCNSNGCVAFLVANFKFVEKLSGVLPSISQGCNSIFRSEEKDQACDMALTLWGSRMWRKGASLQTPTKRCSWPLCVFHHLPPFLPVCQ